MPILNATVAGGATQFDGTAGAGLFDPASNTGDPSIQARINSISFSTGGAITSWTLNLVDPSDGQTTVLLTDTSTDLVTGGPGGFMLLPTNSDGASWQLTFVTVGMAAPGTIKLDLDLEATEG